MLNNLPETLKTIHNLNQMKREMKNHLLINNEVQRRKERERKRKKKKPVPPIKEN